MGCIDHSRQEVGFCLCPAQAGRFVCAEGFAKGIVGDRSSDLVLKGHLSFAADETG